MVKYPNLFKNRYSNLSGKGWINSINPEDKQVFITIGLSAGDHGRMGGKSLVEKYGNNHMRKIGSIGGIMASISKQFRKDIEQETELMGENLL